MKKYADLKAAVEKGELDGRLTAVYACDRAGLEHIRGRVEHLLTQFEKAFGNQGEVGLFSGPGRTEMAGNHTDHQHGCVLAAAVDLDVLACAGPSGSDMIEIKSEGYEDVRISVKELEPIAAERGTSAALVRGIAAKLTEKGYPLQGFRACISSTVLGGSGLSSSAAYEVLIGVIFNHLFCDDQVDMVEIAQIGQYAENQYFGKPCGLMDQLASAVGGIVSIDFQDPAVPVVHRLDYDLTASGYELCIIDSGADHADLTDEYAAIPAEMGAVAAYFGKTVLRDVDYHEFWAHLLEIREKTGDRAVLRAMHFFNDNLYAVKQAHALEKDDIRGFLSLVNRSGQSSATLLQNLYCTARPQEQAVCVALALAKHYLQEEGAVRVHGGGFAGTVQAYVPSRQKEAFRAGVEAVLGAGSCHFLHIRPVGGTVLA